LSKAESQSKRRHLLSPAIQNKILSDYSLAILRRHINEFHSAQFYSIIADGTQDLSGKEQLSICIRYVSKDLVPFETFIGLYEVKEATRVALANVLLDTLTRFSLPLKNLRGQAYDGAANMSGTFNGVQSIMRSNQPLAFYTHCAAHRVNLVCQSVAESEALQNVLFIVHDLGVFIQGSLKIRTILSDVYSTAGVGNRSAIRPLCPTRWSVRHKALSGLLSSYSEVLSCLDEISANSSTSTDQKCKAVGFYNHFQLSSTYLTMKCAGKIFGILDTLCVAVQGRNISLDGTMAAVNGCIEELQYLRDHFTDYWNGGIDECTTLELNPLEVPRRHKVPKRLVFSFYIFTRLVHI